MRTPTAYNKGPLAYSHGPYTVETYAEAVNLPPRQPDPNFSHAVVGRIKGDKKFISFSGTLAECEQALPRYHEGYATWLMIQGTKAQNSL